MTGWLRATALALGLMGAPAAAQECGRACMTGLIDSYLGALLAHDPARLPLVPGARFTEDSKVMDIGKGLWSTVSGAGAFRQDYLDTTRHVAASHVSLREGDQQVLYSLLLHLDGNRISGIETLVQRVAPDTRLKPTELGAPVRGFDQLVPTRERAPRTTLIAAALRYAEGLRRGDFTDAATPFAPDAYRVENGAITAGPHCVIGNDCGLYSQRIMVHPGLLKSVAAVDEAKGVVLLWMNFGFTDSYGPGKALVTYEAFKIGDGRIRAINAFFATLPVSTPRGWPSLDPIQ
ncbi:MAG: hypothetical protein ABIT09_11100 [Croceibacterium sp.]